MVEEVIRAKRFEVVDGAGRPRVIIGTQEEASGLMLLDPNGQNVAELAVSDELGSTTLSLYDLRGSLRASLDLDQEGLPNAGPLRLGGGAASLNWRRGGKHARARLHRPLRGGADVHRRRRGGSAEHRPHGRRRERPRLGPHRQARDAAPGILRRRRQAGSTGQVRRTF